MPPHKTPINWGHNQERIDWYLWYLERFLKKNTDYAPHPKIIELHAQMKAYDNHITYLKITPFAG